MTSDKQAALRICFNALAVAVLSGPAIGANAKVYDISQYGAVNDGKTLNTASVQATIDACAAGGGGTVVVPKGEFITGSVFLMPGVNLELLEGAVLKNSTDAADFPVVTRRIEGQLRPSRLAMINADKCDGLRITGPGTLDGNNPALFEKAAADKFKADAIVSKFPQLCYIKDSNNVTVSDVKFERSAFWNLHFYRCRDLLVEKASFRIDPKIYSPSSDGIDVDSCRNVLIAGCVFDVEDDCIALKGTRGPKAWEDKESPPTENIHIADCTFLRGHGGVSFGTEATLVRNVTVEHCRAMMLPKFGMIRFKIRTDTPGQIYEKIRVNGIAMVNSKGCVVLTRLDHGTKEVVADPHRVIRDVTIENVTGDCDSLGTLFGNAMTEVKDITFRNVDIKAASDVIGMSDKIENLKFENVRVNGKAVPHPGP